MMMTEATSSIPPCESDRIGGRTPVIIITGFLGSGKTSLLNRALRAPEMARTVVVINEFGEVSLDHALAATSDDAVVVLENGCLCCTVRSDLVGTLNDLYHAREAGDIPRFDNVVIETSGLADPGPVLQAFLSEPTLDGLYRVASVIALVDAVNGLETFTQHDEAVRQVALADRVLITKLDLVDPPQAAAKEAELRQVLERINPAAAIGRIDDPSLSIVALLKCAGFDPADPRADPRPWLNVEAYDAAIHAQEACHDHGHGGDHDHHLINRGIESFCFIRDEPITRAALQFLLDGIAQNLGSGLLRVKGLVNVAEEPGKPAVIQGAQHLLHTMTWLEQWPDADHRTRVVFITQGVVQAALKDMIEMLDRIAARTAKARRHAEARISASVSDTSRSSDRT
ncbi:CobW family GTP-binding protein [Bradyrhizobium sp.]|uniref:CobW family GTP-binding protein n=1 Tax=Bradyrhizobium sp. TaxID=376 RepID=UPI003C70C9EE